MYLAVDVGASKTLLALFDGQGQISGQTKFQTSPDYQAFLNAIDQQISSFINNQVIKAVALAIPGAASKDYEKVSTNLQWGETSIRAHLERSLKVPVGIDNDANLAGLAEAVVGSGKDYPIVLYVTLSTGIGSGVIVNKKIALPRSEGGQMVASYDESSFEQFEDKVSGPDIKRRFGKWGWEINDPKIWDQYARDLAAGLYNMITMIGPDAVVLGGGISVHFEKFIEPLKTHLEDFKSALYPLPPIVKATHVEDAVIYGCYLMAKELG